MVVATKPDPDDPESEDKNNNQNILLSTSERTMTKWLQSVWFQQTGEESNLLIADCFSPHTSSIVQRTLISKQSCLAIIPSACSPILQPLHRGIKQKFKVFGKANFAPIFVHQTLFLQEKVELLSSSQEFPSCDEHTRIVHWVDLAYKLLKNSQVSFKNP